MSSLDQVSSEYRPGSATEIENNLILNWYPHRIIKRLEGLPYESMLELGLGHGYTTKFFSQHFDRHVVIEGSGVVISLFDSQNVPEHVEIVQSYFEEFDTKEQFDVILMGFVLEHVDDPGLILERFKRYLKPEGKLYIAVPNAKSLNRRFGLAMGKIDDIYSLNENDLALGHQRQFCLQTLHALVANSGYKCQWEEGIYLKPLPLGYLQNIPEFNENLQAMLKVGVEFPELCVGLLLEAQKLS